MRTRKNQGGGTLTVVLQSICVTTRKSSIHSRTTRHEAYTATEQSVKSTGSGEIKLNVKLHGNATNRIKLSDTMLVPDFRNNLLSVSQITDKNYAMTFYKDCAKVKRPDNTLAMIAKR